MTSKEQKAIATALMFVDSIYQWVDKVEAAGGTTSITGVASAHAFINSLKKNKARVLDAIVAPLKEVNEGAALNTASATRKESNHVG